MFSRNPFKSQTIGSRLLTWFLLLALVPLISVIYFYHTISEESLTREIRRGLLAVGNSKVHEIESLAQKIKKDMSFLSHSKDTISHLENIDGVFREYGPGSPEYQNIDKQIRPNWEYFIRNYGYYDLLLISDSGDIVFSIEKESDFGTNLYNGPHKDSNLANVFRRIKSSNEIGISDYLFYAPSNNPALFVMAPVFSQGNFAGAIAIQADLEIFIKLLVIIRDWVKPERR